MWITVTLADLCRPPRRADRIPRRAPRARDDNAGSIVEFTAENHRCEFRTPERSAVLDNGALTGRRPHCIYRSTSWCGCPRPLVRVLAGPQASRCHPGLHGGSALVTPFAGTILSGHSRCGGRPGPVDGVPPNRRQPTPGWSPSTASSPPGSQTRSSSAPAHLRA